MIIGTVGQQFTLPSGALLRVNANGTYTYDPNGKFDYLPLGASTTDEFTYTIADKAGATSSADVTITINGTNEAPTDLVLSNLSSFANTIVGSFTTVDPDQDDTHAYAIIDDESGAFGISGANLVVATPAHLTIGTHRIVISTTDQNGPDSLGIEQVIQIIVQPAPDTTAPTSSIAALPTQAVDLVIPISVSGVDSAGPAGSDVSGIKEYRLFVAQGSGAFTLFATLPAGGPLTTDFMATSDHTYFFRSLAVDHAGNVESKSTIDTQIIVGDFDAPETNVVSAVANASGLFNISLTGRDSGGGLLVFFDVYVSVDGGVAQLVGSAGAGAADGSGNYSGAVSYQGRTDGIQHTYRFFSIGRDTKSNIEAAPSRSNDVMVTETFANLGLQATGIDVQLGASQRSYIRNLDVLFSTDTGLSNLLVAGRVAVERFALDATDVTAGSGTVVTDFTVDKVGDRLRLDFGSNGITDAPTTNAGDGFYRILIDVNQDGDFADAVDGLFEFHRILGDANGDAVVNADDLAIVNSQFGQSGSNLDGDGDGNGVVNFLDRNRVNQQINRHLDEALIQLLDD